MFTAGRSAGMSAVGPHLHLPQARTPAGDGLQAAEGINGQLSPSATPWVYSHSATQRMPLPHILPSLPSALKMRIMASAPGGCAVRRCR